MSMFVCLIDCLFLFFNRHYSVLQLLLLLLYKLLYLLCSPLHNYWGLSWKWAKMDNNKINDACNISNHFSLNILGHDSFILTRAWSFCIMQKFGFRKIGTQVPAVIRQPMDLFVCLFVWGFSGGSLRNPGLDNVKYYALCHSQLI